jgi:hypothetical protein
MELIFVDGNVRARIPVPIRGGREPMRRGRSSTNGTTRHLRLDRGFIARRLQVAFPEAGA